MVTKLRRSLSFILGIALVFQLLRGDGASGPHAELLPDGVTLQVDAVTVELRIASQHAFLLRIGSQRNSSTAQPGPAAQIYLSGATQPAMPFTQVTEGKAVGIKTAFGEILVDLSGPSWILRDAAGKELARGDLHPMTAAVSGGNGTGMIVTSPAGESPALFYGSGNLPAVGSLTQTTSNARMGNGKAVLPQYWSTAGYGLLMVGGSGDQPGFWFNKSANALQLHLPSTSSDIYLMPAPTLGDWLRADAELTGFAPVPPRWAFGYMQSRWGWESRAYIDDTLVRFRKDALPVDAFIFDFEWYTKEPDYDVPPQGDPKFVDFGWNPALLPDPANQIAAWLKEGLHVVGIRKPRLGNADALASARAKGWINPGDVNDHYEGQMRFRNLDFSQSAARAYWEENNRKFVDAGMAGFWNDEGETTYTKYSYWNLAETDLLRQVRPDARFFSLNRSFIPGMQRFGAAVWTGDIAGDWPTLRRTPGELLSFGLSGMPYSTCDIGGFYGNAPPELVVRWMEAGVFFPLMRAHSTRGDMPHFPWLYGAAAEDAIRQALDLRYRLIPYYYSLAHETAETGEPIMRPLVMEFPDDAAVAGITDEWLMGRGLLAAPVLNAGGKRTVHLPAGTWFRLDSAVAIAGPADLPVTAALNEIPVYVRAGTILPLGPVVQYTGQPTQEPLEVQVYPGRDATFTLVEDDGATTAYESGAMRKTTFTWDEQQQKLSWKVTGAYAGSYVFTAMKVVLFSAEGQRVRDAVLVKDGVVDFK